MIRSNFHTHTIFCDGSDSAEQMLLAAINKGFYSLGFSGHGYTEFDTEYCMKDTDAYIGEIKRLKDVYKDKIDVFLGLEEDAGQLCRRSDFEYIIGSMHYIKSGEAYYAVDNGREMLDKCRKEAFGGNGIKMAEAYFSAFTEYVLSRKPDIIGHFDLITKHNDSDIFFEENSSYYRDMSLYYLKEALKSGCVFEINTGAIARGYVSEAYPKAHLLEYLVKRQANLVLSADAHNTEGLDFYFNEYERILKDMGLTYLVEFTKDGFVKKEI